MNIGVTKINDLDLSFNYTQSIQIGDVTIQSCSHNPNTLYKFLEIVTANEDLNKEYTFIVNPAIGRPFKHSDDLCSLSLNNNIHILLQDNNEEEVKQIEELINNLYDEFKMNNKYSFILKKDIYNSETKMLSLINPGLFFNPISTEINFIFNSEYDSVFKYYRENIKDIQIHESIFDPVFENDMIVLTEAKLKLNINSADLKILKELILNTMNSRYSNIYNNYNCIMKIKGLYNE